MRALSLKDQEKFTSPWAVSDLDEEKFDKTISFLGRLLRDDIQLQALYHMLVMLSPSAVNSEKIKVSTSPQLRGQRGGEIEYRNTITKSLKQYSENTSWRDTRHSVLCVVSHQPPLSHCQLFIICSSQKLTSLFLFQHNKTLVTIQREVAALLYRYLCTSTTMHYSKTQSHNDNGGTREESSIMKLSEGIEDLW